jgi:hypothetical protein
MSKLTFNKSNLLYLLDSLSKINDTCILHIKDDEAYAVSISEDVSFILWGSISGEFGIETTLNLPSLKKLINALKVSGDETDVTLILNKNNLEYRGDKIKFKYHLYDDGILTKPKTSLEKIQSLSYNIDVDFTKSFLKNLLKTSSMFSDVNKLYINTINGIVTWALQDKTLTNSDTYSFSGNAVDFELDDFILNLDNLRMITLSAEENLQLKINTTYGIGNLSLINGDVSLNYILSSLVK